MKKIFFGLMSLAVFASRSLNAQDAATEERLNKLSGRIEDLIAAQEAIKSQLQSLSREVGSLRDQGARAGSAAGQEDVKRLADAIKEVDRKRLEDYDKIRSELKKIANLVGGGSGAGHTKNTPTVPTETPTDPPAGPSKGFEYVIKQGDTLSVIVQAYKEQNIKVTTDQILKANPGLIPEKLKVGQKIFIPAPQ